MNNSTRASTDLIPINIENQIIKFPGRPPSMLDKTLAEIYETEVKYINRAVLRNPERFPSDFMFQLTTDEFEIWRCQNGTAISTIEALSWLILSTVGQLEEIVNKISVIEKQE